jgi:hypothetical protein
MESNGASPVFESIGGEVTVGATVSLRRPGAYGLPSRRPLTVVRLAPHADDPNARWVAVAVPSGAGGAATFKDAVWVPDTELERVSAATPATPAAGGTSALLHRPAGVAYLGWADMRPARTDTGAFLRSVACPTSVFTAQVCPRCLSLWGTVHQLAEHVRYCSRVGIDGVRGRVPGNDIYADATLAATGLTVRMLDGAVHTAFCRNLAVLGAHCIADKDLTTDVDVAEFFVVLGRLDFIFREPGEAAEAARRLRGASAMPDDGLFVLGYFARIKMQPSIALTTICTFGPVRGRGVGSFMFDVALHLSWIRAVDCGNDACCGRLPGQLQAPLSEEGRALLIRECARRLHFNRGDDSHAADGETSFVVDKFPARPSSRAIAAAPPPKRSLEDQLLNPRRRPRDEAPPPPEFIMASRGAPSKVVRVEAPPPPSEIIDLVTTSDDDDGDGDDDDEDDDDFSNGGADAAGSDLQAPSTTTRASPSETMAELTARLLGVHPDDGELFWNASGLLFGPGRRREGPGTLLLQPSVVRAIATGAPAPVLTAEADAWCAAHASVVAPMFNADHMLREAYTAAAFHYGNFSLTA